MPSKPKQFRARRRGASATEYMLIMALVVIPLCLLLPRFMSAIKIYGGRSASMMVLPFP